MDPQRAFPDGGLLLAQVGVHYPGMGRLTFYAVACAVCGASAGFVLWWVGVPVTGAALVGLAGAGLVALLIVLVAALSGRL